MAKVAIEKCYSYSFEEVSNVLEKLNNACPLNVKGKTVLLKPNILSDAKPQDCITTHPEVLRAAIRLFKNRGAKEIWVGDSPGLQGQNFKPKACGIADVCKEEGAVWQDFTQDNSKRQINGTNQSLLLCNAAFNADVVVSMCKFKTHSLMYLTGAVKNLFGLVPSVHKSACHTKNPDRASFARLIVGIHETVKPHYCIMDAIIGMDGAGPSNGNPKPLNFLAVSDSCIAMDAVQALVSGHNINDIPVLAETKRRKIFPAEITYPLLEPGDVKPECFDRVEIREKTKFFSSLILPHLTRGAKKRSRQKESAPVFDAEKCIKCKRCMNICPAKALTFTDKIEIDEEKCIRCFCCHEMCPVNAISTHGKK